MEVPRRAYGGMWRHVAARDRMARDGPGLRKFPPGPGRCPPGTAGADVPAERAGRTDGANGAGAAKREWFVTRLRLLGTRRRPEGIARAKGIAGSEKEKRRGAAALSVRRIRRRCSGLGASDLAVHRFRGYRGLGGTAVSAVQRTRRCSGLGGAADSVVRRTRWCGGRRITWDSGPPSPRRRVRTGAS